MKICYLNSLYSPDIGGGAEITLKSIVEGVKGRGHDVFVITTSDREGVNIDYVDGIKVYRVGIENIYWPYKNKGGRGAKFKWHWRDRYNNSMADRVRDIISIEKPEVASCHNLSGLSISVWDVFKEKNIPVIQVLHDLYLMCYRSTMFKSGHSCKKQCGSCLIFRANHAKQSAGLGAVVGVSNFIASRLKENGYFRDVPGHVINNARNIPDPGTPIVKDDLFIFGYIGTIAPSKGVDWLLEEFVKMKSNKVLKLKIAGVGEASYVNSLKERYSQNSSIDFVGYVKSSDFYRGINACVVPSIWPDTFPGVAFEALAHHVPVICSNLGGLPEIVKDGVNGMVCDSTNRSSLRFAMEEMANDMVTFRSLMQDARSSVASLIDMERMLSSHEQLYYSLAVDKSIREAQDCV